MLVTNDPDETKARFSVRGKAYAPFELQPEHVHFGQISPHETQTERCLLNVTADAESACDIHAFSPESTPDFLKIQRIGSTGNRAQFEITLRPGLSKGSYHGSVVFRDAHENRQSVPVSLDVVAPVRLVPSVIFLSARSDAVRSRANVLLVSDDKEFQVEAISLEAQAAGLELQDVRLLNPRVCQFVLKVSPEFPVEKDTQVVVRYGEGALPLTLRRNPLHPKISL
jgi:hypothetical protein